MIVLYILFLLSIFTIIYIYIGYPFLIIILAKTKQGKSLSKENINPVLPLTIVLIERNEADKIINKLENLIELEYNNDLKSIIIVDDFSTNDSCKIIEKFINNNRSYNITLLKHKSHKGKAEGINTATSYIKSHFTDNDKRLIMFCDTRQRINNDAVLKLVKHFNDSNVAYVSGSIIIETKKGVGMYWKYEQAIRNAESVFYSVVGGTGQLSVIRFESIPELPAQLILDDVYIPMKCVMNGKRVLYEPDAVAYDIEFDMKHELQRKYRTIAGNYQLIKLLPEVLNFKKNPIAFQLISHKFLRLVSPLFLLIMLLSSVMLSISGEILAYIVLTGQILFYSTAISGFFLRNKLSRITNTFFMLNIASIVGFIRFIRADYRWTSSKTVDNNQ